MSRTTTLTIGGRSAFNESVATATGAPLHASSIRTVQVNIGLTCNLACHHCHVESSPARQEQMSRQTMHHVLDAARRANAATLDITGGAPEMNPHFQWFVREARQQGLDVIVRTNLTVLLEEGYEGLPAFFREQRVHLVGSLPCYLEQNVDKQRGKHVYSGSVKAIRLLNDVGYGREEHLPLDLVYNPVGPSLPPEEHTLEQAYRRELSQRFGIVFTRLICITNMAIGRFLHDLQRQSRAEEYAQLLREAFNPATVDGLMCRHQLHVSYDGTLHDCDFNYGLGLTTDDSAAQHISQFEPAAFAQRPIVTGEHCFGCTAGHGSSCGGAIAD